MTACGGGGSASNSGEAVSKDEKPATTKTELMPSCINCAAVSASEYAGQGVGVWQLTNTSAQARDVPIYIQGLNGQSVTLVYSKETDSPDSASASSNSPGAAPVVPEIAGAPPPPHDEVQAFNFSGWKSLNLQLQSRGTSARKLMKTGPATPPGLNESRSWLHTDQSTHQVSLVAQRQASDGMRFNVWVEDGYYGDGKVTAATVNLILDNVAKTGGIYETLVALGGPLWGAHNYGTWVLPADRSWVDIVILDFHASENESKGYFWGLNNYLKSAASASNESLGLVLDAPTVAKTNVKVTVSNVAHELGHMQNFYRRNVSPEQRGPYELWLEEMSAMMVEDIVSTRLNPMFNSIQEGRMPTYLNGNYNCPMLSFTGYQSGCESYSVAGTFGAYVLRQHGVSMFKDLLARPATSSSFALMDAALKAASPSSSFEQAFRKYAVSTGAMLAPGAAPSGYGYPARQDAEFGLMAINPLDSARYRLVPGQLPPEIAEYGSVPLVRSPSHSFYSEVVRVPPGITLSVVVQ